MIIGQFNVNQSPQLSENNRGSAKHCFLEKFRLFHTRLDTSFWICTKLFQRSWAKSHLTGSWGLKNLLSCLLGCCRHFWVVNSGCFVYLVLHKSISEMHTKWSKKGVLDTMTNFIGSTPDSTSDMEYNWKKIRIAESSVDWGMIATHNLCVSSTCAGRNMRN